MNRTSKLAAVMELCLAALLVLGSFSFIWFGSTLALLLLASSSLWLRGTGWRELGLTRPKSWLRTIAFGVAIGIAAQALDLFAITPLITRLTGHPPDLSSFRSVIGSVPHLFFWLAVSWTIAAFGEEMVYRGYLLNRAADLFGRSPLGWTMAAIVSSAIFGLGHRYQGVAGIIDIVFLSLVFVIAYLSTGRNLWMPIIIHGVTDTIGFILVFFHRYPGL